MAKRAVFVGRFSPFHKGHLAIMNKKIKQNIPLLILVRDSYYDVYPAQLRKRMIEAAMQKLKVDAKVMVIDDIESINYGRGVGYEVNEIEVDESIKQISATKIRELIEKGDSSWKKFMPNGADSVLEGYISKKGIVVWLTGLPKAGKKEIAAALSSKLEDIGRISEVITGSSLRKTISSDLGFSSEDRKKNLERAVFIAKILSRNKAIVICSFVSPYKEQREEIRKELEKTAVFIEAYVKASIEKCIARDTTGIYEKAREGKIANFTGISDKYEAPENPEIIVDTDQMPIAGCAEKIFEHIKLYI